MAGFVYLIGSPLYKWYKIGKSSNAAIRVSDLGVLLPFRIEVMAVWKASNHHELETLLHEKYRVHRLNGEWFGFSERQVKALVAEMKMAAVNMLSTFSNIDKFVQARDKHRIKKDRPFYTQEYREMRKKESIGKRAAKKAAVQNEPDPFKFLLQL